jgi:hypothetical protein
MTFNQYRIFAQYYSSTYDTLCAQIFKGIVRLSPAVHILLLKMNIFISAGRQCIVESSEY